MGTRVRPAAQAPSPLLAYREGRGLSLREVSELSGGKVDPSHLSKVERGIVRPSLLLLKRLAPVYGLRELEQLLAPYDSKDANAMSSRKRRCRSRAEAL